MAFPCPAADSLDPMDHFLSFNVSLIIPTNLWKMIHADFILIVVYIRGFDTYNHVYGDVCIIQILLEFSLTWIGLIRLLAFHMPWDRMDSTFHYPYEKLYKEPLGTLKAWENWEHRNYSPLLPELMLESASLCPLELLCALPKLAFC